MRTFLALPLPAPVQAELAAAGAAIEGLRAQRPGTLHLTLRFLGEIRAARPIVEALRPVVAAHAPFVFSLARIGGFPNARRARVAWVGVDEGAMQAGALVAGIEGALEPLGFPRERRPWKGHVTLGRFRRPRALPDAVDRDRAFGRAPADRVVLFRSTLTPQGAVHDALENLSLGGGT